MTWPFPGSRGQATDAKDAASRQVRGGEGKTNEESSHRVVTKMLIVSREGRPEVIRIKLVLKACLPLPVVTVISEVQYAFIPKHGLQTKNWAFKKKRREA